VNTGIAVNPTACAIATVLATAGDSPLLSGVSRATAVAGTVNPVFLYYALFVQTLPAYVKHAELRIFAVAEMLHATLVSADPLSADYQILEVIVSVFAAVDTAAKSKHFNYCRIALLLMHIKPSVSSVTAGGPAVKAKPPAVTVSSSIITLNCLVAVVVANLYLAVALLICPIDDVVVARVTVPSAAKSRLTAVAAALAASRE